MVARRRRGGSTVKIVETSGCTVDSLTFDGIDPRDPGWNEAAVTDALIAKLREALVARTVQLRSVVNLFQYDSHETDAEPCDQCGDIVSTTTWNL